MLLLTIGIPTWNRAHVLPDCLTALYAAVQKSSFAEQVEIVISDNASTDNTRQIVERFQAQLPVCRYFRNESNLEYDRNVHCVLKKAEGRWCWLLNDDVHVEPWSVEYLCSLLTTVDPQVSYICINHGGNPIDQEEKIFHNGNEWLAQVGLAGGLLAQNVYRVGDLPVNMEKYFDQYWIHFAIAHEIMGSHGAMLIKSLFHDSGVERTVRRGVGRVGQKFENYYYIYNTVKNLTWYGYERLAIQKHLQGFANNLPKNVASARLEGMPMHMKYLKMIWSGFGMFPLWAALSTLVFLLPRWLLRLIKKYLQHGSA